MRKVTLASLIYLTILTNPIQSKVNADASYSYQIPLKLPKSRITPKLTLSYNNKIGNTILGVGWTLEGLPIITRSTYKRGINYRGRDTYTSPDGRLIQNRDGNYQSQNWNATSYQAKGKCGDGPCYWIAQLNSGGKIYFGQTPDSRIEAIDKKGSVRIWAVNKVEDNLGNYYEVFYYKDQANGDYYPEKIIYSKNKSKIFGLRSIHFSYETRTDHNEIYPQNSKVDQDKRLKKVEIRSSSTCLASYCWEGDLVRKYELEYTYSKASQRSQLTSLSEYGSQGGLLQKEKFNWQNRKEIGFDELPLASWPGSTENIYPGDFNGDGRTDFLVQANRSLGTSWGGYRIFLGIGDGSFRQVYKGGWPNWGESISMGDFNADGKTDLLVTANRRLGITWSGHKVLLSNGNGSFRQAHHSTNPEISFHSKLHLGDFDGDGNTDILVTANRHLGFKWKGYKVYLSNGQGSFSLAHRNNSLGFGENFRPGDFNGDGRTDFLVTANRRLGFRWSGHKILLSQGDGSFQESYSNPSRGYGDNFYLADYNGDGRTDFLVTANRRLGFKWSGYELYLSQGGSSFRKAYSTTNSLLSWKSRLQVGDFNADGRADILVQSERSLGVKWEGYKIFFSQGDGSFQERYSSPWPGSRDRLILGDYNSDGSTDILATGLRYYGKNWTGYKVYLSLFSSIEMIKSIKHPSGSQTVINYEHTHNNGRNGYKQGRSKLSCRIRRRSGCGIPSFVPDKVSFRESYSSSSRGWGERFYLGDFNGDSQSDFLVTEDYQLLGEGGLSWHGYEVYQSQGGSSFKRSQRSIWPSYREIFYPGDFNGDGRTDFLITGDHGKLLVGNKVYLSNDNGSFRESYSSSHQGWGERFYIGDFNGDSQSDFLVVANHHLLKKNTWVGYEVYQSQGGSSFRRSQKVGWPSFGELYRFGDFNGDGRTDFLITLDREGNWNGHQVSLANESGILKGAYSSSSRGWGERFYLGDFNGDSQSDFLVTANDNQGINWHGYEIYQSQGGTSFSRTQKAGWPSYREIFYPGDFNGDGRTDFIVTAASGFRYGYKLYLSNEENGFTQAISSSSPGYGEKFYFGDFNGDGRTDFLITANKKQGIDWIGHKVFLSKSNLPRAVLPTHNTPLSQIPKPISINPGSTRCTGARGRDCGIANPSPRYLVTSVQLKAEGKTYTTQYEYKNARVYPGKIEERANLGFAEIAKTKKDEKGKALSYSIERYYQKRGIQGSPKERKTYTKKRRGKLLSHTTYAEPKTYNCNLQGCTLGEDNNKSKQVRSGNAVTKQYTLKGKLSLTKKEEREYDKYGNPIKATQTLTGKTVTKTITKTVEYINQISPRVVLGIPYIKRTCVNDTSCTRNSNPDKILSQSKTYYDQRALGQLGDKLQVTKTRSWVGGDVWTETRRKYNDMGLLTEEIDPKGIKTNYQYEEKFQSYLSQVKTTSPGGKKETIQTFEIDPLFGKKIKEVSSDGLTTEITYDEFGRPKTSTSKEEGKIKRKASFAYSLEVGNIFLKKCQHYGEGFTEKVCLTTYKDALGRKVKTVEPAVEKEKTSYIAKTIRYQSRKKVISQPYFTDENGARGSPKNTSTITYDELGRKKQVKGADGSEIIYGYNNIDLVPGAISSQTEKILVNKQGKYQTKHSYYDLDGQIIEVREAVGTKEESNLSYKYLESGALKEVHAPQGVTKISYNKYYWQESIEDPNAGKTTYTYHERPDDVKFGSLKTETRPDPNKESGYHTTTSYYQDPWGRLSKRVYADGTETKYTYDEAEYTYGKDKLTTIEHRTRGYKVVDHYSYDVFGEVVSKLRKISHEREEICPSIISKPCTSQYTTNYDELGRVRKIKYPDSSTLEYKYYAGRSLLESISMNKMIGGKKITYAKYAGYNEYGNYGKVTYANKAETNLRYNKTHGLLKETEVISEGRKLQHYHDYEFDLTGNVTSIKDGILKDKSYRYRYDNLNRLVKAERKDGKIFNYAFDKRGNLKVKNNRKFSYKRGSTLLTKDEVRVESKIGLFTKIEWRTQNEYKYSAAGNLTQKGRIKYRYDSNNMLSEAEGDHKIAQSFNYYDSKGERFLKVFRKMNKPEVRTYYLGFGFEYREKLGKDQPTGFQVTKYILGAGKEKIASITPPANEWYLADISPDKYYNLAGMYSWSDPSGILQKSSLLFYGFFLDSRVEKSFFQYLLILGVITIILLYLRYILGISIRREVNTGGNKSGNYPREGNYRRDSSWVNTRGGQSGNYLRDSDRVNTRDKIILRFRVNTRLSFCLVREKENLSDFVQRHRILGTTSLLLCFFTFFTFGCLQTDYLDKINKVVGFYDFEDLYDGLPSGLFFYHNNHLGSATLVTDSKGKEKLRLHYTPYGQVDIGASGVYDFEKKKLTLALKDASAFYLSVRFTGQDYDPENDLYYYNARYYDPVIGRFTTADSIIDGEFTTKGYNRYSYVHGNPIKYTDPSGHFIVSFLISIAVGAIVGGISSYVSHGIQTGDWTSSNAWKSLGIGAAAGAVGGAVGFAVGAGVSIGLQAIGAPQAVASILGGTVGGAAGGAAGGATGASLSGANDSQILEAAWKGAVAGAAGGLVGSAIGALGSSLGWDPLLTSVLAGIGGGLAGGATSSALDNGNVWEGMAYGAAAGFIGSMLSYSLNSAANSGAGELEATKVASSLKELQAERGRPTDVKDNFRVPKKSSGRATSSNKNVLQAKVSIKVKLAKAFGLGTSISGGMKDAAALLINLLKLGKVPMAFSRLGLMQNLMGAGASGFASGWKGTVVGGIGLVGAGVAYCSTAPILVVGGTVISLGSAIYSGYKGIAEMINWK